MDDDLWETYCISSTEELLVRGDFGDYLPGQFIIQAQDFSALLLHLTSGIPTNYRAWPPSCFRYMFGVFWQSYVRSQRRHSRTH
jgi:hypothetical protein